MLNDPIWARWEEKGYNAPRLTFFAQGGPVPEGLPRLFLAGGLLAGQLGAGGGGGEGLLGEGGGGALAVAVAVGGGVGVQV